VGSEKTFIVDFHFILEQYRLFEATFQVLPRGRVIVISQGRPARLSVLSQQFQGQFRTWTSKKYLMRDW
jgi:hypothetical protein